MRGEEIRENGRRRRRGEEEIDPHERKRDLGKLKLGPLLRSTQRRKKEDRVKDFRIGGGIIAR